MTHHQTADNLALSGIDPTALTLVKEFFNSQFELKGVVCRVSAPTPAPSRSSITNHREIATALRALGEAYMHRHDLYAQINETVQKTIDPIDRMSVQLGNVAKTFYSISNELFTEGIRWKHIVTYFVFSAEFAYHANQAGIATVNDVAQWLARYISQRLLAWIGENGGWVCIPDTPTHCPQPSHCQPDTPRWGLDLLPVIPVPVCATLQTSQIR